MDESEKLGEEILKKLQLQREQIENLKKEVLKTDSNLYEGNVFITGMTYVWYNPLYYWQRLVLYLEKKYRELKK